jgi:3-oxoacyl-[acyl-carrier-protein] synthase II
MLVLEDMATALARGARIYAEVRGYGLSGDAFHMTAPREDGSGALRCMRAALAEAGLDAAHVDYVNAHATSTPLGDAVEGLALGALFGSSTVKQTQQLQPPLERHGWSRGLRAGTCGLQSSEGAARPLPAREGRVAVSSTKGATGHLLGAAGAVESIFAVLAVQTGIVPHTLNLDTPDAALPADVCDFIAGAPSARPGGVRVAMNNSFGFGGTNCSLVFTEAPG